MKKFLLSMACAFGLFTASANEVTFDFSTSEKAEAYGIAVSKDDAAYLDNPTTVTDGAVSLTFDGSAAQAWRWWDDGMRAYGKQTTKKPTLTVAVNGGTITEIVVNYNKTGATYTADEGTWTAAADKKSGTWTGDASSVTLSMTAATNIAAAYTVQVTYTGGEAPAVAAPKISCADNTVTITAEDADAVYYTIDGTEPSDASTKYSAPFTITENVTVKAIAYKGSDKSAVASYAATYVGNYADFAAFAAANTTGTVDGPIYVLYQSADRRYNYLKDSKDGYMLAYTASTTNDNPTLANGDVLASIAGKYSPYAQLPEMIPSAFGEKTTGNTIAPEEYTIEELSLDMANAYVVIKNVSISDVNNKNFTITDETGKVAGYNTLALEEIPTGENFTITGFVCRYNTTLQITPISIEGGVAMETVATPVFSVESGAVAEGTEVTISCATEGAVIFYTTDGTTPTAASTEYTEAITVNEATTINAIAIKEGMLDSQVASVMYTIVDPNATTATFDFNDVLAFAPGFELPETASTGTDVAGQSFSNNAVTLAFAENEASNKARIWRNTASAGGGTQLRIYTTDAFTVSVSDEFILSSIEFVSSGDYLYVESESDNGTMTKDASNNKLGTWQATPDSKTASVNFTITKNSRIDSMTVVYTKKGSAVDSIAADNDENAPVEYYNLQGVRVANPAAGNLYIVRQGNKVTKTIVR